MAKLRGEANYEYIDRYNREAYRTFSIRVSRLHEADILEWLENKKAKGESLNAYIKGLIKADYNENKQG